MEEGLAIMILVAAGWVVFAVIGGYISAQKNRDAVEGVMLGLFLGPIGLLIAVLLPTHQPPQRPRKSAKQLAAEQDAYERRMLAAEGGVDDDEAISFLDGER